MIVVTAPTGNVGSEVVRLLVEHTTAMPFRVAARQPATIQRLYGSQVACTWLDFDDPSTWHATLEGCTILFLVCPQPDPKTVRTQMLPFIDAAQKAGCQRIIYLSVPGADRIKVIPHYAIERHIEASGMAYTLLRPAYFMQNFTRKAPTHDVDIAIHGEIFIPAGKGRISLIDARDVARTVVKICEDPHAHQQHAYYLTGGETLDFYKIATIFSHVLKRPIRYARPSLPAFWYRLRKRHVPWSLLLVMSVEYTITSLGKSEGTSDTLAKILGQAPTTLAQFIEDYRQHWTTQFWA